MASQLESSSEVGPRSEVVDMSATSVGFEVAVPAYDLCEDMKPDINICYELHKSSSTSSSSSSSSSTFEASSSGRNKSVTMKDASTQTINSQYLLVSSLFVVATSNPIYFLNQKVSREEKSLGIMSQKFLMLFLTSQVRKNSYQRTHLFQP